VLGSGGKDIEGIGDKLQGLGEWRVVDEE